MSATTWINHSTSSYGCYLCDEPYASEEALLDHCRDPSVENHFWCDDCRELFDRSDDLEYHLKHACAHTYCETCDYYYPDGNALRLHNMTHQPKSVQCIDCPALFHTVSDMVMHLELATSNCSSEYDRESIQRVFYAFTAANSEYCSIAAFWKTMHIFTCAGCSKTTTLVSAILRHVESQRCNADIALLESFERFLRVPEDLEIS